MKKQMELKRLGLVLIGVGILVPVLLLLGGGYLTSTNAADDCRLLLGSYGVGLLFPGLLFLCGALWLPNEKGLLPNILTVLFAIPAGASTLAILFKFTQWFNVFTIGQGIAWSIVLMLGSGLTIRQRMQRSKVDIVQD